MNLFKFFKGSSQQLLDNETVIRYYNDGDFRVILNERTIAWARDTHIHSNEWRLEVFVGTMERFFYNKLEIPVVLSIEAMINNGATFIEDDREYINYFNFDCPVRIKYYEYVPI